MKTKDQKQRQGTAYASRDKKLLRGLLKEIPEPSGRLNKNEAVYYYRICDILKAEGLLCGMFLPTIERYSVYLYRWWELKAKTEQTLGVQVAESGYVQKDGYQNILTDYEKNFQWFEQKFGFNPADQSKVPKIEDADEDW